MSYINNNSSNHHHHHHGIIIRYIGFLLIVPHVLSYRTTNKDTILKQNNDGYSYSSSYLFDNTAQCYYCKWCGTLATAPAGVAYCPINMNRCITAYRDGMILRGCADDKCLPVGLLFSDSYHIIECCVGSKCNNWTLKNNERNMNTAKRDNITTYLENNKQHEHSSQKNNSIVVAREENYNLKKKFIHSTAQNIQFLTEQSPTENTKGTTNAFSTATKPDNEMNNANQCCACPLPKKVSNTGSTTNLYNTQQKMSSDEFKKKTTKMTTSTVEISAQNSRTTLLINARARLQNMNDTEDDNVDIKNNGKRIVLKPTWRIFPQPSNSNDAGTFKSSQWINTIAAMIIIIIL